MHSRPIQAGGRQISTLSQAVVPAIFRSGPAPPPPHCLDRGRLVRTQEIIKVDKRMGNLGHKPPPVLSFSVLSDAGGRTDLLPSCISTWVSTGPDGPIQLYMYTCTWATRALSLFVYISLGAGFRTDMISSRVSARVVLLSASTGSPLRAVSTASNSWPSCMASFIVHSP